MRIISKYRDYYDTVVYKYGIDPLITYVRRALNPKELDIGENIKSVSFITEKIKNSAPFFTFNRCSLDSLVCYDERYVYYTVVAGNYVFQAQYESQNSLSYKLTCPGFRQPSGNAHFSTALSDNERKELQKLVGIPVFLICGYRRVGEDGTFRFEIFQEIPVLKDIGASKLVSPEQMYQGICETISSVLKKDVDKQPPLSLTNEEKIIAAGFDEKSFRNSKKKLTKNRKNL